MQSLSIHSIAGGQEAPFDALKDTIFSTLHVANIGIVTSIDNGLLTVKPIINERAVSTDGTTQWLDLPEIPDTPYIGNTPKAGDAVLLIFCDSDISGWLKNGGTDTNNNPATQNQEILRMHSLSNAVAITGVHSQSTGYVTSTSYTDITASTANNGTGVSDALIAFIESWEGAYQNWYDDGFGTQTIGYGHTGALPSGYAAPLSSAQMTSLLSSDLTSYIASVNSTFSGYTLSQNQFDACVSFAYNMGPSALASSTLAKDIKAGVSSDILKKDFDAWSMAGGQTVLGLLYRRDAEWAMFCNNQYLANG
jgi:GH24 family phage-related lysozyme (muramidase)